MKRNVMFIISMFIMLTMVSCSGMRRANKSIKKEVGREVIIKTPLNPQNTVDNSKEYRVEGKGTSADESLAKQIAMTDARGQLVSKIQVDVKTALESYAKQYGSNGEDNQIQREIVQSIEQYTISTAKGTLSTVTELERITTRNVKSLEYTVYVALGVSKENVINQMTNKLPEQIKEKINFDKEKFRDYLNNNYFKE